MLCSWMNSLRTCSTYWINWAEKTVGNSACQLLQQWQHIARWGVDRNSDKIIDACVCCQKPSKKLQPL
eukprot:12057427-Ditylum_brightwellii.AAC.1